MDYGKEQGLLIYDDPASIPCGILILLEAKL